MIVLRINRVIVLRIKLPRTKLCNVNISRFWSSLSEPRVKDREMEEGYKRTREERNEVLREEWVCYSANY